MESISKKDIAYFYRTGKENTSELAQRVADRLKVGDIAAIAVATTSGFSALTIVEAVPAGTHVFGVNFQNGSKLDSDIKARAGALGVVFMPDSPVAKYLKDIPGHSPDSFRCFGQGMKVAVEVIMQAVEVGHIERGDRVIGIGGTSRGSDVAIVAKAAGPEDLSAMWISEILTKPL